MTMMNKRIPVGRHHRLRKDGRYMNVSQQQQQQQQQDLSSSPHHHQQQPPKIGVAHSCMLLPVFFGIWWFYFRRKVSKVFNKLMVKNDSADAADAADNNQEFSTWEDVMDHNNVQADPSVRFVRWTKTTGATTTRRRAHHVKQTTNTTLRMAASTSTSRKQTPSNSMSTPMMDDANDNDDSCQHSSSQEQQQQQASAFSASTTGMFEDNGGTTNNSTQWQCLQDVGVDGIELMSCSMSPTKSSTTDGNTTDYYDDFLASSSPRNIIV
eukprot:CAMPEP_0119029892 /NCGR_PEP_ID=MMETSP1176-20130426/40749_1 /TAXON_ID=265551 /ORGANISM="Synedropsis recta cf, Strain CCMP1620" /LENGTH=266 /DNA_ID=CAMNT_0006986253 /DNA_START=56 /DNA_END=856 /DNA_ORIENTATION=+